MDDRTLGAWYGFARPIMIIVSLVVIVLCMAGGCVLLTGVDFSKL